MKQLVIFFILCCLFFNVVFAQTSPEDPLTSIREELKKMSNQLDYLKSENSSLRKNIWYSDSLLYEQAYQTALEAVEQSDKMSTIFEKTEERLKADKALISSASGQNIAESNFEKIMIEAAGDMFEKNERDTAKVGTWKRIVSRLVKNSFLGSVLKSNPVGLAISSVISAAQTFVTNKIPKQAKDGILEMKEAIAEGKIKDFRVKMDSYISYYRQLEEVNQQFHYTLGEIELRYESKSDAIKFYYYRLSALLRIPNNNSSRVTALQKLFRYDEMKTKNSIEHLNFFKDVLNDENIKKIITHANLFKEYKRDTERFEEEFQVTVVKFFREYRILFDGGSNTKARQLLDEAKLKKIVSDFDEAIRVHSIDKEKELRL